ncbi:phosphopantothenoylcysteine decarboxylase [bacterium E08(2017)]|nr:phosphopantothenoylcysteine decarboxylase [bacterium E08(2017)]
MSDSKKRLLLGVTGSIAAYKAAELVRAFKKKEMDVTVVMTNGATKFVSELTFQTLSNNKVYREMFQEDREWCPEHISLTDSNDVMLIAPCTANVMAKIAHGLADDLLTATALACDVPLVIAPAMNEKMWRNTVTQENIEKMRNRGVEVMDTEKGDLACGYEGEGRLASLDEIVSKVMSIIS